MNIYIDSLANLLEAFCWLTTTLFRAEKVNPYVLRHLKLMRIAIFVI